jgi:pSer/pThr/pTyr-binding forkhead associated (FHA) protein
MLQIVVVDIGHRISVPSKPEILIGREDVSIDTHPEVDLTPYGAVEKGVSRRHAKLVWHGDQLTVEDVGSVNGTFLTGQRLVPYEAMPMRSGDVLQLGKLVLQVYFDLSKPVRASPMQ